MRIIAGSARGRNIEVPKGRDTRPTLDRVREAIFGMVQFDVESAVVLDLFAGSGALGLEALSRGADRVVFCDNDRAACAVIEKNLNTLGLSENAELHFCDCFSLINRQAAIGRRFSLVLIDPPYRSGLYEQVLKSLADSGVLEDGCILILEHPKKLEIDLGELGFVKGKPHSYGDIGVTKLVYHKDELGGDRAV